MVSEIVYVFGKQVGSTYCGGLVDAGSEEIFYQKLEEKKLSWEQVESEHPGCSSGFYDWFCCHQCDPIVCGMLRNVREDAVYPLHLLQPMQVSQF